MTQTARLDAALVRRLIAEQFPRYRKLPVAAVVPGGHDNRTFRVGDSLCARLPTALHGADTAGAPAPGPKTLALDSARLPGTGNGQRVRTAQRTIREITAPTGGRS